MNIKNQSYADMQTNEIVNNFFKKGKVNSFSIIRYIILLVAYLVSLFAVNLKSYTLWISPILAEYTPTKAMIFNSILIVIIVIYLYYEWNLNSFLLSIVSTFLIMCNISFTLVANFGYNSISFIRNCPEYGNIYLFDYSFQDTYKTIAKVDFYGEDKIIKASFSDNANGTKNGNNTYKNKNYYINPNLTIQGKKDIEAIFECINQN
jgi:hypothetical protein